MAGQDRERGCSESVKSNGGAGAAEQERRERYFDTMATIFRLWASTISTWPFTSAYE
jgi:hypothetical protein